MEPQKNNWNNWNWNAPPIPTSSKRLIINNFNEQQLEALRMSLGKNKEGTLHQLCVWKNRGFVTYSAQARLYTKTKEYLQGK